MATIFRRKGSRNWYVSYFFDGRRITKSLKTTDRTFAVSEKRKLEGKLEEGSHEEYERQNVHSLVCLYKSSQRVQDRKERTNEIEFCLLDKFINSIAKRTLETVTEADIMKYLASYEKKSRVTHNNMLGVIKRFFRFAIKKKKLSPFKDPTIGLERKTIRREKPTYFSDEEYLRIEKVAENHPLYPMVVTARYTGLRLAELRCLEWEDFDWNRREVSVRNKPKWNHTIKTYEERAVPLCEELFYKLLPFRKDSGLCFPVYKGKHKGKPYSRQGPKNAINNILEKAALKKPRDAWHKLRRTYGSRLVQQGVSIYKVSKWLGHSGVAVTEACYACFAPKYDPDIERLNISKESREGTQTADNFADSSSFAPHSSS